MRWASPPFAGPRAGVSSPLPPPPVPLPAPPAAKDVPGGNDIGPVIKDEELFATVGWLQRPATVLSGPRAPPSMPLFVCGFLPGSSPSTASQLFQIKVCTHHPAPVFLSLPSAQDKVVVVGQPIAVVAAASEAEARAAARAVVVEYEDLTPVMDLDDAIAGGRREDGGSLVHAAGWGLGLCSSFHEPAVMHQAPLPAACLRAIPPACLHQCLSGILRRARCSRPPAPALRLAPAAKSFLMPFSHSLNCGDVDAFFAGSDSDGAQVLEGETKMGGQVRGLSPAPPPAECRCRRSPRSTLPVACVLVS